MSSDVNLDDMFSSLADELKEEGIDVSASANKSLGTLIAELDDSKVQHLFSVHVSSIVRKVVEGKVSIADGGRIVEIFRKFTAQLEACDVNAARAARLRRVKSFTPFSAIKEGDL